MTSRNRKADKPRTKEAVARPSRTVIAAAIAGYLVTLYDQHIDHLSHRKDALLGISEYNLALTIAIAVVTLVWVKGEDWFGVSFLRDLPDPEPPVVDTDKHDDTPPTPPQIFELGDDTLERLAALLKPPMKRSASPARQR